MGSKGSNSTSTVQVPPEVLARYQSVNTRAEQVAQTPFQQYSTDPSAFVAPLNQTQQAGINATNQYAQSAQPYYNAATGQLIGAQNQSSPYYGSATSQLMGAQQGAQPYYDAATGQLMYAQSAANPLYQSSNQYLTQAQQTGSNYYGQAGQALQQGTNASNPFYGSAAQNITGAQGVGNYYAGASQNALASGLAAAGQPQQQAAQAYNQAYTGTQPLQNTGIANITGANQTANPFNQAAAQQYYSGLGAANPYIQNAGSSINAALQGGSSINSLALSQYMNALPQIAGLAGSANGAIGSAGGALSQATQDSRPYLEAASNYYNQAGNAAKPLQDQAAAGFLAAGQAAQPALTQAQQLLTGGTQAVNPTELDQASIEKYLSPYLSNVLQGTQSLLNQQNQQAMAGQTGNAIQSGAFGGDRAGIAAAVLAGQQRMADASTFSNILNTGYNQALGTAQQQQQLGLGAAQANRAALQQGAGQALNLGSQLYGQGMGTAQAQAGLGSQLYNQAMGQGQAQAGLGEQIFGQGATGAQIGLQGAQIQAGLQTAAMQAQLQALQGISGLGQQQFQQGLGAAQAQAGLGQQVYGMGSGTGQNLAALGQQLYGQQSGTGQAQLAAGQQLFGQGMNYGQAQQGLGQQLFGQGATTSSQLAGLGQQQYGQGLGAATAQQGLGQALFGQGATGAQTLQGLGQAAYGSGANTAAQQQALAQALFGTGAATSQGLQGLGQAQYQTGANTANQLSQLGQAIYGQRANTSTGLANLGAGAQGAALSGAQAQMGAGQAAQQTDQAGLTALYNQFLQQQSYPFQVAQFLANIAMGTGSLSGSTTTTNQTQNGIFSDERLKENVKKIGETYDGQPIYSFRYKGEPQTQIGLMAQEVERRHPEAVGESQGYKTVDYKEATADAERPRKAYGGGFDPTAMQQILANYQAMYGPLFGAKGGLGAASIVPQANLPVSGLQAAQAPRPLDSNVAQTVTDYAKAGKSIGELGDKFGLWDWAGKGANDDAHNDNPEDDPEAQRLGLAAGGAALPYMGTGLDIPNEQRDYELMTAQNPSGRKGGDLVGGVGKTAGAALAVAKLLPMLGISDRRAKEDIRPVGKTYDGQTVYSYRYKGDKTTHMGLIAQEVEKKHPKAVGKAGHLKTVDNAKATKDAAKRGKFAIGGDVEDSDFARGTNPLGEHKGLGDMMRDERQDDFIADDKGVGINDAPDEGHAEQPGTLPDLAALLSAAPAGGSTEAKAVNAKDAPPVGKIEGPKGKLGDVINWIASAEGTGKNPKSSATGYGQFTDGTFVGTFRKTFPELANLTKDQILAKRGSGVEKKMMERFTADNVKSLEKAGFEPSPTNIYLAHFLGDHGAKKVLGADPETPISKLVRSDAISANPSILGGKKTAQDIIDWSARLMAKKAELASRKKKAFGGSIENEEPLITPETMAELEAQAQQEEPKPPVQPGLGLDPAALAAINTPAPNVGQPQIDAPKPMGLGAAQPQQQPGVMPDQNFFRGIKEGKASSIIPLLTGIAAFGTANTKNPLTALATGLGAGAQAAQGQRQFGLEQQYTGAKLAQSASSIIQQAIQNFDRQYKYNADAADPNKRYFGPNGYESVESYNRRRQEYIDAALKRAGAYFPGQNLTDLAPMDIVYDQKKAETPAMGTATPAAEARAAGAPPPKDPESPYGVESFFTNIPTVDESQIAEPTQKLSYWQNVLNDASARGAPQLQTQAAGMIAGLKNGSIPAYTKDGQIFTGYQQQAAASGTAQQNIADARKGASATYQKAQEFLPQYVSAQAAFRDLDRAAQTTPIEAKSGAWAKLFSAALSIPGIGSAIGSDELKKLQAAAQTRDQNAAMLSAVQALGLPAESLVRKDGTVAGPAASYALVTQLKAKMEMEKAKSDALLKLAPGSVVNMSKWERDWYNNPAHSYDKFHDMAVNDTRFYDGMSASDMRPYLDAIPVLKPGMKLQPGQYVRAPNGRIFRAQSNGVAEVH